MDIHRTVKLHPAGFLFVPVMDLVFLLLLFLLLNSTVVVQSGISVELPQTRFSPGFQRNPSVVTITSAPTRIYFEDQVISLAQLQGRLSSASLEKTRNLIIKADRRVSHETIIQVVGAGLDAGYDVALAAGAATGLSQPASSPRSGTP
jgi:biopolymer transport protein ExbD